MKTCKSDISSWCNKYLWLILHWTWVMKQQGWKQTLRVTSTVCSRLLHFSWKAAALCMGLAALRPVYISINVFRLSVNVRTCTLTCQMSDRIQTARSTANDQWFDCSMWGRWGWRLKVPVWEQSSLDLQLWPPTPALLPHIRRMTHLKSVVQAHVSLSRTQLWSVHVGLFM